MYMYTNSNINSNICQTYTASTLTTGSTAISKFLGCIACYDTLTNWKKEEHPDNQISHRAKSMAFTTVREKWNERGYKDAKILSDIPHPWSSYDI